MQAGRIGGQTQTSVKPKPKPKQKKYVLAFIRSSGLVERSETLSSPKNAMRRDAPPAGEGRRDVL